MKSISFLLTIYLDVFYIFSTKLKSRWHITFINKIFNLNKAELYSCVQMQITHADKSLFLRRDSSFKLPTYNECLSVRPSVLQSRFKVRIFMLPVTETPQILNLFINDIFISKQCRVAFFDFIDYSCQLKAWIWINN